MKCLFFLGDDVCCTRIPELAKKVSIDEFDDQKRTAAIYAAVLGKYKALKQLIELGADLTVRDVFRNNIFHLTTSSVIFDLLAAYYKQSIADLLNEENVFGWTPYDVTTAVGAKNVAAAMLANGAKIGKCLDPPPKGCLFLPFNTEEGSLDDLIKPF